MWHLYCIDTLWMPLKLVLFFCRFWSEFMRMRLNLLYPPTHPPYISLHYCLSFLFIFGVCESCWHRQNNISEYVKGYYKSSTEFASRTSLWQHIYNNVQCFPWLKTGQFFFFILQTNKQYMSWWCTWNNKLGFWFVEKIRKYNHLINIETKISLICFMKIKELHVHTHDLHHWSI